MCSAIPWTICSTPFGSPAGLDTAVTSLYLPAPSTVNGTDVTVPYSHSDIVTVASENATSVTYNVTNAAGEVVKAYTLTVGDIFEVSAEAFDGTPAKNAALTVVAKKLKIGA